MNRRSFIAAAIGAVAAVCLPKAARATLAGGARQPGKALAFGHVYPLQWRHVDEPSGVVHIRHDYYEVHPLPDYTAEETLAQIKAHLDAHIRAAYPGRIAREDLESVYGTVTSVLEAWDRAILGEWTGLPKTTR